MALPKKTENSSRVKKVSPWYHHKQICLRITWELPTLWIQRREGPWCGGRVTGITCHHHAALGTNPTLRMEKLPSADHHHQQGKHSVVDQLSWKETFLTSRSILASFPILFACRAVAVCRFATGRCGQSLSSGEAEGSLLFLTLWCWADWSSLLHHRLPVMPWVVI